MFTSEKPQDSLAEKSALSDANHFQDFTYEAPKLMDGDKA